MNIVFAVDIHVTYFPLFHSSNYVILVVWREGWEDKIEKLADVEL